MAKAENIASGIAVFGGVLVGAGILVGERNAGLAYTLWFVGIPIAIIGFAMLLAVGAVSLGRRLLRAIGVLPTPVEPAVPGPGWQGWRFTIDDEVHEVWFEQTGLQLRIVCDGRWADATHSGSTEAFMVGRWPATITGRVDLGATAALLPLAIGAALLSGGDAGSEPPPMRYELRIGGTPVPDDGRVIFGQ